MPLQVGNPNALYVSASVGVFRKYDIKTSCKLSMRPKKIPIKTARKEGNVTIFAEQHSEAANFAASFSKFYG
ncbi:MAG: hypothetical protein CM15mP58_15170 [Burkholderiaceae bacterium]|nr:MAG: hypothetical protein CM15mP58_15170 [Burkholderiaceae bacterium]